MRSPDVPAQSEHAVDVHWHTEPLSDARMGRLLAILFQPRPADEAPEQAAKADRP